MRILTFIVIFLLAALAGSGIGTGGLLVLWLTLLCNTEQLAAQGANLFFFITSAVGSLFFHVKKRKLYPIIIIPVSAAGILGTFLGSYLAETLNKALLRKSFGILLILSGLMTLSKSLITHHTAKKSKKTVKNREKL